MYVRPHGFTLLELMTAIAVLAVLFGLGIPAFASITRNSQIAAQSAGLVQALTLARSEAVKRGVRVSVCASGGANVCAGAATWNNGWIVFADDFGAAGVIDVNDVPIQTWPGSNAGVQLTMPVAAPAVTFARTGRAEFARTFKVTKPGCTSDQQREIDVSISGRIRLKREVCGS